MRAQTNI